MNNGNLVLTRRLCESITISLQENIDPMTPIGEIFDEIVITPIECHGRQVKLIINANKKISVMRTELINTTPKNINRS